ncbi:MAG: alcohol dehydrogenase catalytic domain-containing protein [Dehalococcoidia bacterium]
MKAYRLTAGGGIDGLQLLDLPEPEPAADEVVVAVRATSLNYRDLMLARSNPEAIIPLSDGAGDVIAAGSRVTGIAVGDRVAGCFFPDWIDGAPRIEGIRVALGGASTDGMLAERVVLRAQGVVKLPASLTYEEARRFLAPRSPRGTRSSSRSSSARGIACSCWARAACRSPASSSPMLPGCTP